MIAEALRPLAVLFLTALLLTAASPRRVDAAVSGGAYRVAVLEFDNASAGRDLDPLGKGLQSMLTTDLGQVPQLELVERARLADVQAELKLGKSGALDPKTAARLGKLKKFNKPNPDFGNTLEDIKQLVLAEFGWNEKDVADYEEVLKNWNNDKEIVEIPDGSPPPVQASESWDSDSSSITFNSTASATVSGSEEQKSGGSGRDWDAELQELLQSNPNPDFGGLGLSPYGAGYVIWNEDHTSYRVARAEDKVRLLKGEVTADELRGS